MKRLTITIFAIAALTVAFTGCGKKDKEQAPDPAAKPAEITQPATPPAQPATPPAQPAAEGETPPAAQGEPMGEGEAAKEATPEANAEGGDPDKQ